MDAAESESSARTARALNHRAFSSTLHEIISTVHVQDPHLFAEAPHHLVMTSPLYISALMTSLWSTFLAFFLLNLYFKSSY